MIFKGFTFLVEKKVGNEVKNIFLYDKGGNLRNLSTSTKQASDITIIAENGMIDKKKFFLFNGQIISSKDNGKNEMIKFESIKYRFIIIDFINN